MERILDFSQPLDVALLDQVVDRMYKGTPAERAGTQKILTQFQDHPEAWTRVDTILDKSQFLNTKYYALLILESVVKYKWKALPREQCEGIKMYIVNLIIRISSDPATLAKEKVFVGKLNNVLVQVLKQEWPRNWENFIPEIVSSSKTNETLCENNLNILKLLSEEVFDFSTGQMTQAKTKELKTSFNKEFSLIYELCEFVLERATKPSLVVVALETLHRFLGWIPVGYIFETKMIDLLTTKFFPEPVSRNPALQCLTEIASLTASNNYDQHFVRLFTTLMSKLMAMLPSQTNVAAAYENGSDVDQMFIKYLALFFSGFFRAHIGLVERPEHSPLLLEAMSFVIRISMVEEVEVFKICLEYWNLLASELYHETPYMPSSPLLLGTVPLHASPRRVFYGPVLSKVRQVFIGRMPRPEEVLIVENENEELVRELIKDTDAITLYKSMRETLIYLTHLDCDDTQNIMLEKLAAQVDGSEWSWNNLNTLCWAIGSISGALNEEYEKRFLVTVIKDLLGMCEIKRGKDNKAVVASNIMYVVGQYPRFLRAHWRFLKTVVNKLFEFMHESHPGIQDMACDTFMKIAQKCRKKFVMAQHGETVPFVEEILTTILTIIADLEPHQVQSFYESMGYLISSCDLAAQRDAWIAKLMEYPNQSWTNIMAEAGRDMSTMVMPETMKQVAAILKTNVRAATSLGHCYVIQLGKLFLDLLSVYRWYSQSISTAIQTGGIQAAKFSNVIAMRTIKRETLRLFEVWIERSDDPAMVTKNFLTPLLNAVLGDYQTNIPDARDSEVLSLMTCLVNRLQRSMLAEVPRILEAVLDCTLGMITKNFEDYPDHRIKFFNLMRAINSHCFQVFFQLPPTAFSLLIDCVVWAFKHTERTISETGLNILLEVLHNVSQDEAVANAFYQQFCVRLLQEVLVVLFDSWHKSGFKLQALILRTMFHAVEANIVKAPLWDWATVTDPTMTNQKFLRDFVENSLNVSNVSKPQVHLFVQGLFDLTMTLPAFKAHLRDFIVQLKEFSSADNAELFKEEQEVAAALDRQRAAAIPGMIRPVDQPHDDMAE